MGKAFPLILALIAGGVIVYLYSTGQLAGVTTGAQSGDPGAAAGLGVQQARKAGEAIYVQPWFGAALSAAIGAALARWLWKKMSGPVRGALIALVTIAMTVFVLTVKR